MSLGNRLRELRKASDLTLDEASEKIGISKPTLQKYEVGAIVNMPFDKVEKMAELYKSTPAHIVGWDEYDNIRDNNYEGILRAIDNKILDANEKRELKYHFAGTLMRYKQLMTTITDLKASMPKDFIDNLQKSSYNEIKQILSHGLAIDTRTMKDWIGYLPESIAAAHRKPLDDIAETFKQLNEDESEKLKEYALFLINKREKK